MWNESQTTVLQVDSGTENGTVIRYELNILILLASLNQSRVVQ